MSKKSNIDDLMYLRMTKSERIQHFLLLSTFITLIVTGFGLKFPEAFWVKWIVFIIGENAFEARGIVHRIASLIMIAASFYHLFYILFTARGKQLVKDFLPKKQDIIDFKNSMLYLIGQTDEKPKIGRFSYIEKMEYWAVVWGTVIMGATGFILWFENFFLKYVGTTGMDISSAIHYYEAILASLAILVWHYYFVFLNPDVYPMNKAWYKGYITREQMEHEHPLELEQIEMNEINTNNKIQDNTDKIDSIEIISDLKENTDLNESIDLKENTDLKENIDLKVTNLDSIDEDITNKQNKIV